MKKVKRIFALLLAMAMTLSLGVAAMAADNGTITITNATVGKDYIIYQIFEASTSADGSHVAYLATEAQKTFYEGQPGNVFKFTATDVAEKYNVSIDTKSGTSDTYTNAEVIKFLQSFVTETEGGVSVNSEFAAVITKKDDWTKTATSATVDFTGLPYGYYLVTSTLGSVVTVDSTNPAATVIDKNQDGPSWETDGFKMIVNADGTTTTKRLSANYGETVNFQIKFDATNYDGEKGIVKYTITDTLAKGLNYVMNGNQINMKVTVQGASDTTAQELFADAGYTVKVEDVRDVNQTPTGEHKFTLEIDWQQKSDDAYNGVFLYESPATITVTYSAKVTDAAVVAGDGNKNTATIQYTMADGSEGGGGEGYSDETTTYTYALAVKKIDAESRAALQGAVFTLKDAAGRDIYVVPTEIDGVYAFSDDTSDTNRTREVTSPENGVIIIRGVAAGEYKLTETKAPAGYNLLDEPEKITAVMDNATYAEYKYDESGNLIDSESTTVGYEVSTFSVDVENASGSELPSTGGMGTTVFYVLGAVLVLGAAVLLITKRRMNAEK